MVRDQRVSPRGANTFVEAFQWPSTNDADATDEIIWLQNQIEAFSMLARYGDVMAVMAIANAERRIEQLRALLAS